MPTDFKVQVAEGSKYYKQAQYDSLERFISYYHQIDETRKLSPTSVLEIGIGSDVTSSYLKSLDIKVTTCDFDANVGADVVADVRQIPLPDESFDLVMAYQILEHIPFEDFDKALAELCRISKKNVIISLPFRSSYFELVIKMPFIRTLFKRNFFDFTFRKAIKFPGFQKSGQHYWEIDPGEYKLKIVREKINKHFNILKELSPILNKYHYFFVLEKKDHD